MQPIGRDQIARMYEVVKPHIRKTPVLNVSGADFGLLAFPLTLKLESLQHAGSFKTRGAFAHLLTRDVPPVGVVAASGGNHGVAVAYAASRLGVPATIFVPNVASPAKIARIQAYGADLKIVGERYADALRSSENWAKTTGAMPIHAFDEIETVLGQGTLALELSAQAPGIDTLFFSVGGGGLIAGVQRGMPIRTRDGCRAGEGAYPDPRTRCRRSCGCAGWRNRRGLAGTRANRRTGLSNRSRVCRKGLCRDRRGDSTQSEGSVGCGEDSHRAWRSGRVRSAALRRLPTSANRTRRSDSQRRQYNGDAQ